MYGRVDTAANGAAEGPLLAHASREDSGVISAKERTVANGITVSGISPFFVENCTFSNKKSVNLQIAYLCSTRWVAGGCLFERDRHVLHLTGW